FPEFPGLGTTNAEVSNQRSNVRWSDGRLPSRTWSGRPPVVLVFDGSAPEKLGVKYCPDSIIAIQLACQPPSTKSTTLGAVVRNCLPRPTGKVQAALATPRNLEVYCSGLP